MKTARIFPIVAAALIFVGIVFRFYQITENDFVFFDEGYYLNWNRPLGQVLAHHRLNGYEEFSKAVYAYVSRCLGSGKTLWFMLVDARFFFGALQQWYVARVLAALLGVLTLVLTFIFSKRFFNNVNFAWAATALLAILPSHVFYSRIGMQESLSTVLVLAGFYFYFFPPKFGWRVLAAGFCWGLAYFSNYRLIMLPVLFTFAEIFLAVSERRWPDFRRWLWAVLAFLSCVVIVGNFNNGQNSVVIFSWIFHQASMAQEQFAWANVFSYPYYLFRLETFFFAVFFLANFYFIFSSDLKFFLPFILVIAQMAVFTFASEKGARYVGVVLPFMCMAVVYCIFLFRDKFKQRVWQGMFWVAVVLMAGMMVHKSFLLIVSRSDYRRSVSFLQNINPQVKFLSSQNYIQNLYVQREADVHPVPSSFESLINEYKNGYHYLVLCPQAYISLTEDKQRFTPQLRSYLGFLAVRFMPKKIYPNFSSVLLERFVLEHNENLVRSIKFLNKADQRHFGILRVYDLTEIIPPMLKTVVKAQEKGSYDGKDDAL